MTAESPESIVVSHIKFIPAGSTVLNPLTQVAPVKLNLRILFNFYETKSKRRTLYMKLKIRHKILFTK
jgi:hypothetical protein